MVRNFDGFERYEYENLVIEPNMSRTRLLVRERGHGGSTLHLTVSLSLDEVRRLFDWLYTNLPRAAYSAHQPLRTAWTAMA